MGWRLSRNSPPVVSLPCTTGRGTALSDRPSDTAPSTSQAAPRKPSAEAAVPTTSGRVQRRPGLQSTRTSRRANWPATRR